MALHFCLGADSTKVTVFQNVFVRGKKTSVCLYIVIVSASSSFKAKKLL